MKRRKKEKLRPMHRNKIHPSAYVRKNTIIEKEVEIAEMACVGARGMTLHRDTQKSLHWRRKGSDYPVILREGVFVGARSIIMRGTKWNTEIGQNSFVGPNVSIGHDVIIGKSCVLLSGTILCGSVRIEDFVYIAPGCLIRDNLKIGKGSFIGLGSLVLKDVKADTTVYGRPAKEVEKNVKKNPYGL